jgi:hypothetical protein
MSDAIEMPARRTPAGAIFGTDFIVQRLIKASGDAVPSPAGTTTRTFRLASTSSCGPSKLRSARLPKFRAEGSIVVGKINDNRSQTFGFNAQKSSWTWSRPASSTRRRSFGSRCRSSLCGRSSDHHGSHGCRGAKEGVCPGDARWGWHGRHGLLGLLPSATRKQRPRISPRSPIGRARAASSTSS